MREQGCPPSSPLAPQPVAADQQPRQGPPRAPLKHEEGRGAGSEAGPHELDDVGVVERGHEEDLVAAANKCTG